MGLAYHYKINAEGHVNSCQPRKPRCLFSVALGASSLLLKVKVVRKQAFGMKRQRLLLFRKLK